MNERDENECIISGEKPEEMKPLWKRRRRWENNIKMKFKEVKK
jgi:hypothetical protein